MRLRNAVWYAAGCFAIVCLHGSPVHATSLKVSPLHYDVALAANEKKKGFVDITNPTSTKAAVNLTVRAFRQVDDNGSLEFYENTATSIGVLLDYNEVELGPHETIHLAFVIDGALLPSGDVFAAILASTVSQQAAAAQVVQVGTLLMITNGAASHHEAAVSSLAMAMVQVGEGIETHFTLRNTIKDEGVSGFSPEVAISMSPYGSDTVKGPLLFAGRSREVTYIKHGDYFGIVRFSVASGSSEQSRYGLVITGYWRWLAPLITALGGAMILVLRIYARRKRRHATPVVKRQKKIVVQ